MTTNPIMLQCYLSWFRKELTQIWRHETIAEITRLLGMIS